MKNRHVRAHAKRLGLKVYPVPGDGNCQQHSLKCALAELGIYTNSASIRTRQVEFLRAHPRDVNFIEGGIEVESIDQFNSYDDFLAAMATNGTYSGDHMLCAAASVFNVEISVINVPAGHIRSRRPQPALSASRSLASRFEAIASQDIDLGRRARRHQASDNSDNSDDLGLD